ncbi:MAG: DNA polymerase III subunit delta [Proteobacteria bacterium]|nr:DNA polymerase III subunit delta [Pseudomonadota bacterium]
MVALKAAQASSFLAKPDPKLKAVLLYGPDAGLVSERAQKLAALIAGREKPPGEIVRLDDADLEDDPDKLSVELLTVPMFGGAKIVRATAGRRINAAAVQPLIDAGLAGALIVEAGNLRPDDKMRALFEKSGAAAAIACYADEGASLDGLISEVLKVAGLDITPDARQELLSRLGADRVLSRSEVEKLALYAHGEPKIEIAHVEAIVGDASDLALDTVIAAAAAGNTADALAECDRAIAGGESAQSVILAAERHFHRLHRLRAGLDAGRSMDDLARQMRPPLPFRARAEIERQCRAWTTPNAATAISRIAETVRRARTTGADEAVLAERLLIEIARLARSSGGGSRRGS